MKRAAALGALCTCIAAGPTARAQRARKDEAGLRVGMAEPACGAGCEPHFGPAARADVLFAFTRGLLLGVSLGQARFSYVDVNTARRFPAKSTAFLGSFRVYPVLGRRAELYFELELGMAWSSIDERCETLFGSSEACSASSPAAGIGAGVPIIVAPWLRAGPYVSGTLHGGALGAGCQYSASSPGGGGGCATPEPAHTGYVTFGIELTALFGH